MKLAFASALLVGSATAFTPAFGTRPNSAMKMSAVDTEKYTFAKSEEIFAEAQEVSTRTEKSFVSNWTCFGHFRDMMTLD